MQFIEAIKSNFQNYSNFKTRACRSEFWWFTLFLMLAGIGFTLVDVFIGSFDSNSGYGLLSTLFNLATIIPSFAVSVRRLHDVGHSGWWLFIALTGIGILLLLFWYIKKGDEDENEYGGNPLHTLDHLA